jgi:Tat protein secretion system quality control protein TatD with DNase activity
VGAKLSSVLMFDCHAHLTAADLQPDLQALLFEAQSSGVQGIIAVSEGAHDAEAVIALCTAHSKKADFNSLNLHPAIGMHPEHANLESLQAVLELIHKHQHELVCIGEVGSTRTFTSQTLM